MNTLQRILVFLVVSLFGCASTKISSGPPPDASESFADAINSQNIEAAMAHWSDGAFMYFQSGDAEAVVVSREEIRENYEHMFEEGHGPSLTIRVDGSDRVGGITTG